MEVESACWAASGRAAGLVCRAVPANGAWPAMKTESACRAGPGTDGPAGLVVRLGDDGAAGCTPGCGSSASTVPAGRPPVRPPGSPPGPPVGWNAPDHESLAGFRSGRRRAEPEGLAAAGPPSGGPAASPVLGGGSNAPRLGTSPAGRGSRTGSAGRTPGGAVRPPAAPPGTRRGSWPGATGSWGTAGGWSPGPAWPAPSPSHVGGPSSPSKRARSRRPLSAGRAGRS
jgi:hypothetical protein